MPRAAPKVLTKLAAPPPKHWSRLYSAVVRMRAALFTPVDVIGCHMLADRAADAETQRFQSLVALMLSAQTRDACTAAAMRQLMAQVRGGCTAPALAAAGVDAIRAAISCVCFYNNKARHIHATAQRIVADHGGLVPRRIELLLALPGVGHKMANIFKECSDGEVVGIGIDTHMHRMFRQWRWASPTACPAPDDTMRAMHAWLPRPYWGNINEVTVGFGQAVCGSRAPLCGPCLARHWCPASQVPAATRAAERQALFVGGDVARPRAAQLATRDIEDLMALAAATRPAREKLVAEFGMPPTEREWTAPTAGADDGDKPVQVHTAWLPAAKATKADKATKIKKAAKK